MNNHKKSFPKLVHIYQTMHCNVEENEICILFAFRLGFIVFFCSFHCKIEKGLSLQNQIEEQWNHYNEFVFVRKQVAKSQLHGGSLISGNSGQYHPHPSDIQSPQSI